MSPNHPILSRLDRGSPLLLSADPSSSLAAQGVEITPPCAIGRLVREHPVAISEHYHREIAAGVDVLFALTSDTMPRALAQIGMPFRSAALTGTAVELALDAADLAPRPIVVAGLLGNTDVAPMPSERMIEDLGAHALRLSAAGCELLITRGFGGNGTDHDRELAHAARRAAIVSAATTQLPTWAVLTLDEAGRTFDGTYVEDCAREASDAGADLVVLEVPSFEAADLCLDRAHASGRKIKLGIAVGAADLGPEAWAAHHAKLIAGGLRVMGGGHGTTTRHIKALSALLHAHDRASYWPKAV